MQTNQITHSVIGAAIEVHRAFGSRIVGICVSPVPGKRIEFARNSIFSSSGRSPWNTRGFTLSAVTGWTC
jgi:hypothetical protein